mgnify:FL=1
MTNGISGVDHLVNLVHDLDAARETYRRLGFTLTERAEHSAQMGTANTCIMFGRDYFELLTVVRPTDANSSWRQALENGDGPSVIALATGDAEQVFRALERSGVGAEPPVHFSRDAQTPEGVATAKFSITRFPPEATPAIPMFACQHHTPELVWRPEWQDHENGALGIATVSAVVNRPAELERAYQKIFGSDHVNKPDKDTLVIDLGGVRVQLPTPSRWAGLFPQSGTSALDRAPGLLGFSVLVRDIGVVRQLLSANDIACHGEGTKAYVDPEAACGALLEFAEPD